jgi:hypothetical protein
VIASREAPALERDEREPRPDGGGTRQRSYGRSTVGGCGSSWGGSVQFTFRRSLRVPVTLAGGFLLVTAGLTEVSVLGGFFVGGWS